MSNIKTRESVKDIKVLDKAAVTSERMKTALAWFKEHNQWVDGTETHSPGMIIFYDWDSPNGESGPQDGLSDHTGIVERVENGIVYTVEGSSGDSCRQCHRAVGNYEILGYGVLIP